jgi:hypothetical protein
MRMRRIGVSCVVCVVLGLGATAQAVSTLRVGNQVLTAGDSAVRVIELLGKPSHKSRSRGSRSSRSRGSHRSSRVRVVSDQDSGEKWQYRRDDHVTTVTIVDGKVSDIDDHRL